MDPCNWCDESNEIKLESCWECGTDNICIECQQDCWCGSERFCYECVTKCQECGNFVCPDCKVGKVCPDCGDGPEVKN